MCCDRASGGRAEVSRVLHFLSPQNARAYYRARPPAPRAAARPRPNRPVRAARPPPPGLDVNGVSRVSEGAEDSDTEKTFSF